ncbi:phage head closure protein [Phaeobacter inhibens]|uniref:phage head closure protein n=1 Tax=Phaeobacter inhibens TaxID=221822 RepID=UPI0021A3635A|nr:phage head closure protein [Phaeobacter inhibens]UWR61383.1 phage head closure protein [Phaeobacter inhibens]
MRIAERDRRITILQAETAENDAGEQVAASWGEYAKPWASYEPVSDGERLRAAAVEQKTDARFQVIWSPRLATVNGEYRLRFDGADWRITGIKEIGFRERLEISAWRLGKQAV